MTRLIRIGKEYIIQERFFFWWITQPNRIDELAGEVLNEPFSSLPQAIRFSNRDCLIDKSILQAVLRDRNMWMRKAMEHHD